MSHHVDTSGRTNARVMGIRSLLDEAHANLPAETLAELLLAVRRTLQEVGESDGAWWTNFQRWGHTPTGLRRSAPQPIFRPDPSGSGPKFPSLRPEVSQAARVYLRSIELLVHIRTERAPGLSQGAVRALDEYLDDLASRPRGAVYMAVAPPA